jgi:hypothetical protein
MKRLTFALLIFISGPLYASHIVGGEIELLHIEGFLYRVNLVYYFDVGRNPNRNIQAEEPTIEMFIFRKSDNAQLRSVTLQWVNKIRVPYTQPSCSSGEIISDKIIYTTTIELPANLYSDPQGYYITWARCCRNYTILNIFSQDPTHNGSAIGAGQTFYLEFPPVTINNERFINSSPRNFPALNDYACPTKPYYVDFAGVDDDGDSLVYTLTTPLSTVTVTPTPPATPSPYPLVTWLPGFALDKIVNGNPKATAYPDLNISAEGFLRVTPRSQGLYVFAVKVEEFRNNIKIGELRRDFQMLVTDCRLSAPPEIKGKHLTGGSFQSENLSVNFNNTVNDEERCIVVSVSDPDANRAADNFEEFIKLKIVPLNFKNKELASLLPAQSTGIIKGNGTIEFNICLPACPFFEGGPYQIGVIAFDDACALPLSDTLKVEVNVERPHNERAKFVTPDEVTATLNEGDQVSWPFEAQDADGDELLFFALTNGFSMTKSGMITDVTSNDDGVLKGTLSWDAFCDIYDFTKRTDFTLRLLVDDLDQCDLNDPDTATYRLKVLLPGNAYPIIDTDLTTDPAETEVGVLEKRIYDALTFTVTGKDIVDNDPITLKVSGDGFNPSQFGMLFPTATANGTVSSVFRWDLTCDKFNLDDRSEFNIGFVAIDSTSKCKVRQIDSLVVKVKVLKPLNAPPQLSIVNVSTGATYNTGNALVAPGQQLSLQMNVSDTDISPKDQLTLTLIDTGGDDIPEGWAFEPAAGPSVLSSVFTWGPQCSIFKDATLENDFYFDFRYADDRCLTAVADTIRINVKVKDIGNLTFDREPANVFTPNNDGYNDYYSMERRDDLGNLVNILPPDNCQGVFQTVRIYNRWGRTVFTSTDKNFRWLGLEESAGVYFYHIVYTNRDFKGTVSLRD